MIGFSKKEKRIFLLFFLIYAITGQYLNWNENSRIDLTMAIVEEGSISIDSYYNNTGDRAYYNGHYYSDKAPGLSFIAILPYFTYRSLFGQPYIHDNLDNIGVADAYVFLVLFLITAISAVAGAASVILVRRLLSMYTKDKSKIEWLTIGYGFGTLIFIYSSLFFGHAVAAFFGVLSFYLIKNNKIVWAGAAIGAAVLVEYTALAVLLGCLLYLMSFKKIIKYVLGMAPILTVLFLYHHIAFGSMFLTGYGMIDKEIWYDIENSVYTDANRNLYQRAVLNEEPIICDIISVGYWRDRCFRDTAVALDDITVCEKISRSERLLECRAIIVGDESMCRELGTIQARQYCRSTIGSDEHLLSYMNGFYMKIQRDKILKLKWIIIPLFFPGRGLFFLSPFLLLGLIYFRKWLGKERRLFYATMAMLLAVTLLYSLSSRWSGGTSFGARHYSVVVPYLVILSAVSDKRVIKPLVSISVFMMILGKQVMHYDENFASVVNGFVNMSARFFSLIKDGLFTSYSEVFGLPHHLSYLAVASIIIVYVYLTKSSILSK